jgi:CDP-glycerol glycerophosphotransferase (TagB/SpsB family)
VAPKYNRLELFIRRLRRSRFSFLYAGYLAGRHAYRGVVSRVTGRPVGWVGWLQQARWTDQNVLELNGWAYQRGSGRADVDPRVTIVCRNARTGQVVSVPAEQTYDVGANARARLMPIDYGSYAFRAAVDVRPLWESAVDDRWQVQVRVVDTQKLTGNFVNRMEGTSAGVLWPRTQDGRQLQPIWTDADGLTIEVRQPDVIAEAATVVGGRVELVVAATAEVASAALMDVDEVALNVEAAGDGRYRLTGELPLDLPALPTVADTKNSPELVGASVRLRDWRCQVQLADGRIAWVASSLDEGESQHDDAEARFAFTGDEGRLVIRDTPLMLVVEQAELIDEPLTLRYRGQALGDLAGAELILTGARQDLPVELELGADGTFTATAILRSSRWGGPELPPVAGSYVLRGRTADGQWFRVGTASVFVDSLPLTYRGTWVRARFERGVGGRVVCLISPPLADDQIYDFHQAQAKEQYHARTFSPEESVYFESFNGRVATCNTYALDREVARRFPEMKRYWAVLDYSVAVPDGAIPVVKGTQAWWEARSRCRYIIVNEWIRQKFKHQPFQVVLQTWHGSMFKRIGLDRPNFSRDEQDFLALEKAKWDILLSQNAHSTEIFRSAYAWDKPIWEEGYPRNDDLSTKTGESIRQRLGIAADKRVVLYAPTWRDDHEETMVDFLDLPEVARQLGDDYVILLRGHSRTLRTDANVRVSGVLDVTSYPHVTDLFLAADVMITDYSSVMFDYSVTGRPMIFFTPDLDKYRDKTRGSISIWPRSLRGRCCTTRRQWWPRSVRPRPTSRATPRPTPPGSSGSTRTTTGTQPNA